MHLLTVPSLDRKGQLERGREEFEKYYGDLFLDRWPALYTALRGTGTHADLSTGLKQTYYLDPASIAVAELLPLFSAKEIVDLCAAPGGKSLVLTLRSAGIVPGERQTDRSIEAIASTPRIVLNEKSNRRRRRLIAVIDEHLPDRLRDSVYIYGHDATKWGIHRPETAEAILADVPCSSEAHVLADPEELNKWSRSRITRNAAVQHAILAAAIDTLRPNGYVLYATCALTPEENDRVIAWAISRRRDQIVPIASGGLRSDTHTNATGEPISQASARILSAAERTQYGLQILPDIVHGAGPLYCALLHKRGVEGEDPRSRG